jgi:CheY-like chemotaxis protein/anti-sigma regulatory factor (Ser/Thr protein kinase)
VRWALRVTSPLVATKGRVIAELGEIPLVTGDETRLGQVFLNLIVNAAQAMDDSQVDRNELFIAPTRRQDTVVITVRDTGCGMHPDELKHIFEPFFTTKTHNGGTGLGLYVCHTILQHLGGRLEVESETGQGSTFRVTLPTRLHVQRRPSSLPPPGLCILLVDAQPVVARALSRTVGERHQVVSVNAHGALQALRDQRFDLIVCELSESSHAGESLYVDIAREFPTLAREVVFVTGNDPSPEVLGFVARLENPTLQYPLDSEAVERIVRGRTHA